jgi:hypothetical protein
MIADNVDEHSIKKQKEVLEETVHMIPDTKNRLDAGVKDLQDFMVFLVWITCLPHRLKLERPLKHLQ